MKKGFVWLMLVLTLLSGLALADVTPPESVEVYTAIPEEGKPAEDPEGEPEKEPITWDYDELTVGTTTPLTGAFFTSLWGNTASDIDLRLLIHGYNLVEWDTAISGFAVDQSVISGSVITADDQGNHVYNIALYDDLYWSDGTRVTAWDYAFSWMLTAWPGISELGGAPVDRSYLLGMDEWCKGETKTIAGIRVVADDQLALTVSSAYLPFFYELGLLDCTPVPISSVAPGCRLADDGEGVYLAGGELNANQLRRTLFGENGYILHPTVSCGPYALVSYDGEEAHLELNPNYKGDSKGIVPKIPRLVLRDVDNETMVSMLASGELGLLNKCTNIDAITEGVNLVSGGTEFTMTNYLRSGFGFMSYNCERPAMASKAVRKAIAMCLDKDAAVIALTGNYGLRVDGYYGIGQWMVELLNGTLAYPVEEPPEGADAETVAAYEEAIAEWEALSMDDIPVLPFDVQAAIRLLEEDGWTEKDANGIRCKTVDGQRVALDLKALLPEGSPVGDMLAACLIPNLQQAGMAISTETVPFDQVTAEFYRQEARDCDMIFLASNFDVVFDPSPQFLPGGDRNWSNSADRQLYDLAVDMRRTRPGDMLTYCKKWIAFQQRFAEELPMLPIYSNVYFDFYPRVLQEYHVNQHVGWSKAIIGAFMSDYPDEEQETEESGEDGELIYVE